MYRQKVDISYCGDKTGFPRPGHICSRLFYRTLSLQCYSSGLAKDLSLSIECSFVVMCSLMMNLYL